MIIKIKWWSGPIFRGSLVNFIYNEGDFGFPIYGFSLELGILETHPLLQPNISSHHLKLIILIIIFDYSILL